MMKRLLCLLLCLMLALPAALAETADTLPKLFARQLSGGNGTRGYIRVSASGVADWLNLLLPFTATEIQVRAIGQKQGTATGFVTDDDDWQVKLYVKNSEGQEAGTTWLYGNPGGMYVQSELLPDTLLEIPVTDVNLLYQLFRGEISDLLFAFDPLSLKAPGENGNASAYQAVANVLGIPEDTWTAEWLPVLEKYFTHLDLWLSGYGEPSIVAERDGALSMIASFSIPVEALKAEAKYLIGQMLYDNELQNLLIPLVTMEQRITYLNPQMVYFYEACIDAIQLSGNVVLSREMSALGEVVATTVELPLPPLPDEMQQTALQAAKLLFQLSDEELLEGMERLVVKQAGQERTIILSGSQRTVVLSTTAAEVENGEAINGTFLVAPAGDSQQRRVSAAFTCTNTHRVWQDEKYINHDTNEFSLAIHPAEEDASFQPIELSWTLDYRNNPNQQDSPAQVNLNVVAVLPDAELAVEAVLRITTQMTMENLPTDGAENIAELTDERKADLLSRFLLQMAETVSSLNGSIAEESTPEASTEAPEAATETPVATTETPAAPTEEVAVEPTTVPPVAE
ncbi:MAG: hypothetical protein PUC00_07405 [Clostridiales bacterium]|nr:hypothetical protein [Clostridiales bacterium]